MSTVPFSRSPRDAVLDGLAADGEARVREAVVEARLLVVAHVVGAEVVGAREDAVSKEVAQALAPVPEEAHVRAIMLVSGPSRCVVLPGGAPFHRPGQEKPFINRPAGSESRELDMSALRSRAWALLTVALLAAGCIGGPTAPDAVEESLSAAQSASASWVLGAPEVAKREIRVDERLVLSWTIENTGYAAGETSRQLKVNNELTKTLTGQAGPGESASLQFEFQPSAPGTYVITLEGAPPVSIVVREPASIKLSRLEVSPQKLRVGETVSLAYEAANVGGAPGTARFDVLLNGRTVRTEEVNLEPGKSASRVIQLTIEQRGANLVRMGEHEEQVVALAPARFVFGNLTLPRGPVPTGAIVPILVDVHNTGDEEGSAAIDVKVDNVVKVSKTQLLSAGERQRVELAWTPTASGTYSLAVADLPAQTVVAKRPAAFTLSQLAVAPVAVEPDQLVSARVVLKNTGELSGTHVVRFLVDGAIKEERRVDLMGGQDQTLEFQWSSPTPNTYELGFEGAGGTQVKVLKPAKAVYEPFQLSAQKLTLGEILRVNGAVRNVGEVAATFTVPLLVDGVQVATAQVHVPAGGTVEIPEMAYQVLAAGSHTVAMGDAPAKTITVLAPLLVASSTDEGSSWDRYVEFYITVKNTGNGIAKNVVLETWEGEARNQYNEVALGDLQPGQSVTKTFTYILFGGDSDCTYYDIYYKASPTFGAETTSYLHRYCQ